MGINLIKPNIPPNIERINKHLYGVRFSWVRVGWVKAFPFLLEDSGKRAFVTGNGEIVLNMDDPDLYQLMLSTLVEREAVNRYTTAELHVDMTGMTNRFENDMDVDGVINRFVTGVTEALDVAAEGVHQ